MAETLRGGHEKLTEHIDLGEVSKKNLERAKAEAAASEEHDHTIDRLQDSIHAEAISAKEITIGEHRQDSNEPVLGTQRELKRDAYARSLKKIHSELHPAARAFSKLVHHKAVETASEVSGKTIARPSGILGGGIAAFVGSGLLLYLARYYGFEYNFTTFLLLLSVGFVIGLVVELLFRTLKKT